MIAISIGGFLMASLDCMYMGFCAEIVIQFRILSQCLEDSVPNAKRFDEMELYIQHHRLLLRCINKFQQAFSIVLMVVYFTLGPLICVELFTAMESHNYQAQVRHAASFLLVSCRLCFYCTAANFIGNEALAVSNAVYSSKWYVHEFSGLRATLLLMIQNSQNGITIKAGGLVIINAETIVKVLRVAWSACSILRGLRQN
ncbi:hypothetical protein ILUMI_20262 [Ignelater luminosus]|uniref:Uncharacterized protein n=1 Tax=Ignelater luminosus TaxID=2038154 RepID=A0A8K0CIT3_IGNLU|nr:hypothetical protein ILUMI_20262 [Ignelater luminosus]